MSAGCVFDLFCYSFFKECPHPDDKQRKELSRELGLEPLQVKFWFQNKRTQMKVTSHVSSSVLVFSQLTSSRSEPSRYFLQAQQERGENAILKAENEKLQAENNRYKEALNNATCPNCGGPAALGEMSFDEQHLRIENARLREEVVIRDTYNNFETLKDVNQTLISSL